MRNTQKKYVLALLIGYFFLSITQTKGQVFKKDQSTDEVLASFKDRISKYGSENIKRRTKPSPVPTFNVIELEKQLQKLIAKTYSACPLVYIYDSSDQVIGAFSAVSVSADGLVLTAAHCIIPAGKIYKAVFADGRTCTLMPLGTFKENDMAMMKIIEKGTWPYAQMGWSSSLKPDMPCFSISFPGGDRYGASASIKFGHIIDPLFKRKNSEYMATSMVLQKGDSGGPDFDFQGRVISIHSQSSGTANGISIPIDLYRKYWDALLQKQAYQGFPAAMNFPADPKASTLQVLPGIDRIQDAAMLNALSKEQSASIFRAKTKSGSREAGIYVTLVSVKGLAQNKGKSYLIGKSSVLDNDPEIEGPDGSKLIGKVLKREKSTDLALIEVERQLHGGIKTTQMTQSLQPDELGKLLLSPMPNTKTAIVGVVSHMPVKIPATVGLYANAKDGKVTIIDDTKSAIREAKLQKDDQLLAIKDNKIHTLSDVQQAVFKCEPNDIVTISYERNGQQEVKKIRMLESIISPISSEPIDLLFLEEEGGASTKLEGYSAVATHDGHVKSEDCGGPVFGIDGRFYGINIARTAISTTLMIPATQVQAFIRSAFIKK